MYATACLAAQNNPDIPYVAPVHDYHGDCRVNMSDLAVFVSQWIINKDLPDFSGLASEWLKNDMQTLFTSPAYYTPFAQP